MYKSAYYEIALNAAKSNAPQLIKTDGELNVSQLARASGVTQPTLKRIFDGEIQQPKAETLKKLGKALKISWGKLVEASPTDTTENNANESKASNHLNDFSPEEQELLRTLREVSPEEREYLMQIFRLAAQRGKPE